MGEMDINLIRVQIDENSILKGPTKEEVKNYKGRPEDFNYYVQSKKYDQLEEFIRSSERVSEKLINPLFCPEESKKNLAPKKIKSKTKGKFSDFILVDDLIDYVCKKNRIQKDEISKESFQEMEEKVKDHNSIIRKIYLKELILNTLTPAISRVFMEDCFTEEEKNQISSKKFDKRGPKNLEFLFYYDRAFKRGETQIYWNALVQKCSFFKVNEGGGILSPAQIDVSSVPIDKDNFFVGAYGGFPGASFLEINKKEKKIYIYINEEIFKASSLNLCGTDLDFFISMVDEIISNKIQIKINDWEVEISPVEINSFFGKIKSLREGISWERSDNDHSYSDPVSFFLTSMFAIGNYAYKNATPESFERIEKIEELIRSSFCPDGPKNKKNNKEKYVEEKIEKHGLMDWWNREFTVEERGYIESANLTFKHTGFYGPGDLLTSLCYTHIKKLDFDLVERFIKKKETSPSYFKEKRIQHLNYFYSECIDVYNTMRDNQFCVEKTKEYCYKSIEISEKVLREKEKEEEDRLNFLKERGMESNNNICKPSHPGYLQMCVILEREKKYREALEMLLVSNLKGWSIDENGDRESRLRKKLLIYTE